MPLSIESIPLAQLLCHMSSSVIFANASREGLGSYNLFIGVSWNMAISVRILDHTSINHLEFFTFLIQLLYIKYIYN